MILLFILSLFGKGSKNAADEAQLVEAIARGDQQALSQLYDTYTRLLYSLIIKIVKNQEVAEDILQEVFVQVWDKASKFDGNKGTVYTWLTTMSRNKSIDHLRSKTHKNSSKNVSDPEEYVFPLMESVEATPLDATIQNDQRNRINQALGQIPAEQKEIIEIAYFQGYTQSEIAAELDLPLGTVKTRMRQGMIKLKEIITATV